MERIRGEDRLGQKVGMIELDNTIYSIDAGKVGDMELTDLLIKGWWQKIIN